MSVGAALLLALWAGVSAGRPARGYLATLWSPAAALQQQLLGAPVPAALTVPVQPTTAPTATADSLLMATAQRQFAVLQRTPEPVANPHSPAEWAHNARLALARGDVAGALSAYQHHLDAELPFIDPVLDYVALLQQSQGPSNAQRWIAEQLRRRPDLPFLLLANALLAPTPAARLAQLQEVTTHHPQYGPAYFFLAEEYAEELARTFTRHQAEELQASYTKLQRLEVQGNFTRYWLDQVQANARLAKLGERVAHWRAIANQLTLAFMPYYSANEVTIDVALPETQVRDLQYNVDSATSLSSTGVISAGGGVAVNTTIGPLPLKKGNHTLYLQYTDALGNKSELFSFNYRVEDIVVNVSQLPPAAEGDDVPLQITLAVVAGQADALYTYRLSLDAPTFEQSHQGLGSGIVIETPPVPVGEHTLFVQAELDGVQTNVVEYPLVVK
jgi:hypothetical protein